MHHVWGYSNLDCVVGRHHILCSNFLHHSLWCFVAPNAPQECLSFEWRRTRKSNNFTLVCMHATFVRMHAWSACITEKTFNQQTKLPGHSPNWCNSGYYERFSLRLFLLSSLSFLVIGFFLELFPIPNSITILKYSEWKIKFWIACTHSIVWRFNKLITDI